MKIHYKYNCVIHKDLNVCNAIYDRSPTPRRGATAIEAIVVAAIVLIVFLLVLMSLPRSRESARLLTCRDNLRGIGEGMILYDQVKERLPEVSASLEPDSESPGPLATILDEFGVADLRRVRDEAKAVQAGSPRSIAVDRAPGMTCQSDPNALVSEFKAPVSYRANTGSEPGGVDGPFAPGVRRSIAEVEAGDGSSFTAAYSERLVGDGREVEARQAYRLVDQAIERSGCGSTGGIWKGDAGFSWRESTWRSTLYNHLDRPNPAKSCIARDGRTADMGASSGHIHGVNTLFLDGGVRFFTNDVDSKIWRDAATTGIKRSP